MKLPEEIKFKISGKKLLEAFKKAKELMKEELDKNYEENLKNWTKQQHLSIKENDILIDNLHEMIKHNLKLNENYKQKMELLREQNLMFLKSIDEYGKY